MKLNLRLFRNAAVALFSAAMAIGLGSCSMEKEEVIGGDSQNNAITFNAEMVMPTSGVATKGALYDNTTFTEFTVYGYNSVDGVFMSGVKMVKEGSTWKQSNEDQTVYEFPTEGETRFYGVSAQQPEGSSSISDFLTVSTSPSTHLTLFYYSYKDSDGDGVNDLTIESQPSLMLATDTREAGENSVVNLSFAPALTALSFSASGDYVIESLKMTNYKYGGIYNLSTDDESSVSSVLGGYNVWNASTLEKEIDVVTSDNNTGDLTSETGYFMMVPQNAEDITLNAEVKHIDSGETKSITVVLEAKELEASHYYNYNVVTGDYVEQGDPNYKDPTSDSYDYTLKSDGGESNCYIINPHSSLERVYHFPIENRINTFWSDYSYDSSNQINDDTDRANLSISQLWNDGSTDPETSGLDVQLVTNDEGVKIMQVVVPAGYSNYCNALYAVKKGSTTLWSWHLWMTSYSPTSDMLDRYIGQTSYMSSAHGYDGTMLYQYGRKDPFVSKTAGYYTSSVGSIKEGVQNPTKSYSNYYYSYSNNYWASDIKYDNVWGDVQLTNKTTGKSIFDPSPYGYRIPNRNEWGDLVGIEMIRYDTSATYPYLNYSSTSYGSMYFYCTQYFQGSRFRLGAATAAIWTNNSTNNSIATVFSLYSDKVDTGGNILTDKYSTDICDSDQGYTYQYGESTDRGYASPRDLLPVRSIKE
ncbi:MAG: hypothetical protein R3Y50_09375 [Rikenellaceae bacterium]